MRHFQHRSFRRQAALLRHQFLQDGGQRVREGVIGEDVGERQPAVLEELVPQEGRLSAERPVLEVPHR